MMRGSTMTMTAFAGVLLLCGSAAPALAQTAISQPGLQATLLPRPVTVRYTLTGQTAGMILISTPQAPFTCQSYPLVIPGQPLRRSFTCTAAIPRRAGRMTYANVQLRARYVPNIAIANEGEQGIGITGAQWAGACSGTTGETCQLSITGTGEIIVEIKPPQ